MSEVYRTMQEEHLDSHAGHPADASAVAEAVNLMTRAVEQANSRVAVPPPPTFDNSDCMYSISDFFLLFEPYAAAVYGPKSRSWILALQPFVAGDVKAALLAIGPIHAAYDDVKQRLMETYSVGAVSNTSPQAQFISASRLPGESLQVFRFRLERLAAEAFGGEHNNKLIIAKFLMNLKPDIKNSVEAHILSHENATLDIVVNLASTLERNTATLSSFDPTNYIANVGQVNVSAVAGTQANRKCLVCHRSGHREESCFYKGKPCFNCGRIGPFAKDCSGPPNKPTRSERRNLGQASGSRPSGCVFCEEEDHKMAQCPLFLGLLRRCNWCGEQSHDSFQCKKKPATQTDNNAGEVYSSLNVNMLMQTKFTRSCANAYFVEVKVLDDLSIDALVDNGSSVCLISDSLVNNNRKLRAAFQTVKVNPLKGIGSDAVVDVIGIVTVSIALAGLESSGIEFLVVSQSVMSCQMLLGLNFLENHYMIIDTVNRQLRYCPPDDGEVAIDLKCELNRCATGLVRVVSKVAIPARSRTTIRVAVTNRDIFDGTEGYFEPNYDLINNSSGLIIAHSVNTKDNGTIVIEVMNVYNFEVHLDKNTQLGTFFQNFTDIYCTKQIGNKPFDTVAEMFDLSDCDLTETEKEKVKQVLYSYRGAISCDDSDLGLTSTIEHKIDVQGAPPVKQRYCRFHGKLRQEVEDQQLKIAGLIGPSFSALSSPIVPTRKRDGSLRIFVYYIMLNARIKLNSFPLPNKVDILNNQGESVYFSILDMSKGLVTR